VLYQLSYTPNALQYIGFFARRKERTATVATSLLPNLSEFVRRLLYGSAQCAVNRHCCLTLHIRQQVAANVRCDRDRAVSKPFLNDRG
jgi:hypothetical protein